MNDGLVASIEDSKLIQYQEVKKIDALSNLHSSTNKNTNNNNRRSILFQNGMPRPQTYEKKMDNAIIDSRTSDDIFIAKNIEKYYKSVNVVNEIQRKKDRKINKLFKGLPTLNATFDCITNTNNTDSDAQGGLPFEYYFYSYLYPSETDDGLMPFLEHFDKNDKAFNSNDDIQRTNENPVDSSGDRRLRSIENKCRVKIKIGSLLEKPIKGLPRRKVTISALKPEHVATSLSCMEESIPELFDNAIFIKDLDCKTLKWPCSQRFLVRPLRRSTHFHKRSLNCPLMGSIWFKSIDPQRIFPFKPGNTKKEIIGPLNTNRSNEYSTIVHSTNVEEINDVTEQTAKLITNSVTKQYSINIDVITDKNNNKVDSISESNTQNTFRDENELFKYLKFPYSEESNDLFQFNTEGQPVSIKFKEYLTISKCHVENMKCRINKFGNVYHIVKIRYQCPSQLAKLFLLLKFKIKY